MSLRFVPFGARHYAIYDAWFADPVLSEALGGIDDVRLDYILADTSGREYAVLDGEQLVGVVGLLLPTHNHREVVITNLAVKPDLRRSSIGTRIIRQLPQVVSLRPDIGCLAYVHERNLAARCFFEQNGWRAAGNNPPEDEMIPYSSK